MGKNKQPVGDYPGADPKSSMNVLPDKLPDDFAPHIVAPDSIREVINTDPYGVFRNAPSVAILDPGYEPNAATHTQVVAPEPAPAPVEEFLPDMADPRVRALYVNQALDRPPARPDADPLDVRLLALLERLHHGGLVNPFASDVRQDLRDLIPRLRDRVCVKS